MNFTPVSAKVKAVTEKAVLLVSDIGVEAWVPKSCIDESDHDELEVGVDWEFNIATWFVEKEF